ncbi:hypothetical protein P7K49_036724 [Saguinus oedipus]|uniref:Vacuolar protein 14 C-terminal Fig4-binding domain-containing protein n=1 Tax=Saguinus oedipus TaxID=9490 RepID=A0ABQ9TKY8_SAGOE|nr:hypothetical protein P7K49_036724 [Saguinus oedipus]
MGSQDPASESCPHTSLRKEQVSPGHCKNKRPPPRLRRTGFQDGCTVTLPLLSRQLCLLLNAENIFHSMADILLREEDLKFASTMVHALNTILLTSTELFQLRNQLKDLKTLVGGISGSDLGHAPACQGVHTVPACPLAGPGASLGEEGVEIGTSPGLVGNRDHG